jgi:hypothetical protein
MGRSSDTQKWVFAEALRRTDWLAQRGRTLAIWLAAALVRVPVRCEEPPTGVSRSADRHSVGLPYMTHTGCFVPVPWAP